jgi:hypothetical protein
MAETIKLKISRTVAAYVRPGLAANERLKALESSSGMVPSDRLMLIFCMMRDAEPVIRSAANTAFLSLPDEVLFSLTGSTDVHPAILDAIAKTHHERPGIAAALLENTQLSTQARSFLQKFLEHQDATAREPMNEVVSSEGIEAGAPDLSEEMTGSEEMEETPTEEVDAVEDEAGEEFLSKYKMSQEMGIAEKIKMALTGDKEWRNILIKDANKLVSGSVIKNPRITEAEIVTLLKAGLQNDEIMRLICANKEWVKNYSIRKALVDNHRTPLQNALRYLASLSDKDIAGYAKSKNVSSVISTNAKRLLLNKKR